MKKKYMPPLWAAIALGLTMPATAEEAPGWTDRVSLKGDFRLRYERIDEEGEEERDRTRYRARLALTGEVSDSVSVHFRLASGADSPVSRNVTLDGGFTTKDIGFDLAYVDWAFADDWHLYGGKMSNPLVRPAGSGLIWDSDLNPEGLAVKYSGGPLFATAALFSVEERSSSDDSLLTALQFGGTFELADNIELKAGAGYFAYSNTIGNEPFYDGSANGNSVDIDGNYIYDYKSTELFAALETAVADVPLTIFAQHVRNNDADEEDSGYAVGAIVGIGKADVSWTYADLEADAVVATFSDSNFGGGGTDAVGHIIRVSYPIAKGVGLRSTLFVNEIDRFQGEEHDYDRFQLDVSFSFR